MDVTPVIGPILALLKSRKTWVAIATFVVNIALSYVPALADIQVELIAVVSFVGVSLMGLIAYEDVGKAQAGR